MVVDGMQKKRRCKARIWKEAHFDRWQDRPASETVAKMKKKSRDASTLAVLLQGAVGIVGTGSVALFLPLPQSGDGHFIGACVAGGLSALEGN